MKHTLVVIVTWWQVAALVVLCAAVAWLALSWLVHRLGDPLFARQQALHESEKALLRREYERLAGESAIYQGEIRTLVEEMRQVVETVRDAYHNGDWDPEEHLARLDDVRDMTLRAPGSPADL